jgi:coenzyme F420-0:L-glutamate ligase/coenzyme F420-1:gamma-L-glutamate ligase
MFSLGTAEARAAGLRDAATLTDGTSAEVDPAAVERAVALAGAVVEVTGTGVRLTPPPEAGPADLIRLGADAHRLRAALAAEGLPSTVSVTGEGIDIRLVGSHHP